MKLYFFLLLFVHSLVFGQGLLPGLITYQNSGNQPVPGALVKTGLTNRTESAVDGTFSLSIPGKQAGYEVVLKVEKQGYEVVNKKELFATLRADDSRRLKLYLCPVGEWERNAIAFYQINEGPITQKYLDQVSRIRKEMASQEQLMIDSLATLAEQYKIVLAQADELSEKFAIANLDDVSDLYEEAFHLFKAGKIEEALASLNEQKLSALQSRIERERAEGRELIAIGEKKLLAAEQAIRQGIENYVLKARLCVVAFRFDEADLNFRKAVKYDSLDFDLNFEYAHFLQQQNRFQPATAQYQKVRELAKDSAQTAMTLNNLGIAYNYQNDYARGIPAFEEALEIYRKLAETNETVYLPDVANTLNNLGIALVAQNDYARGIPAYEKALQIYRKFAETNEAVYLPDVAMTLNNLGIAYNYQNDYARGIPAFEGALEIYRKLTETNEAVYLSDVANTLNNLGEALRIQNDYARAMPAYEEALQIRRKLAETNEAVYLPFVATTLNNLGNALTDQNDYARGIPAYEEALEIYRKLTETNEAVYLSDVAKTLNNLGLALVDQNDYARGIPAFEEALEIYRKLTETNEAVYLSDVATTLNNLGNVYAKQNDYARGIPAYEEALEIYRKLTETNEVVYLPNVAMMLNNLGAANTAQNDLSRGILAFEEVLQIRRKLAETNEAVYLPDVAKTLNNLGITHFSMDQIDSAIVYMEEAISIRWRLAQQQIDRFGIDAAGSMIITGIMLNQTGNREEALSLWLQADSLLKTCPDTYRKQQYQQDLDRFLAEESTGQTEENPLAILINQVEEAKTYKEKVKLQNQLIAAFEEVYKEDANNLKVRDYLAQLQGSLSWYRLFINDHTGAETAARRGLELNPEEEWINTNLAHALLFQGKFKEAKELYQQFKGQAYDETSSWEAVFLEGLDELEEAGITHPDVKKIRKLLMK